MRSKSGWVTFSGRGPPDEERVKKKVSQKRDLDMNFKQEHTKEARKAESSRIREKFPDRIPVICERAEKSR